MGKNKVDYICFFASIASYLIMSLSFMFMPADIFMKNKYAENIVRISGLAFWVFLLAGAALQIVLMIRYKRAGKPKNQKCRVGLVSFFKNPFGIVADVALAVSIIGFVVSMIMTNSSGYICYVFVSLLVFSFCMHCVLNGKVFYNIRNK